MFHDGSRVSAERIVAFCGPLCASVAEDGTLTVLGNEVSSPGVVVNPYRGGFLVLSQNEFNAGWEV